MKNSEQMKGPNSSWSLGKILTLDVWSYSSASKDALLGAGVLWFQVSSAAGLRRMGWWTRRKATEVEFQWKLLK